MVVEDDVVNFVRVVHDEQCFGIGAKSVAKPMDGGLGFHPITVSEQLVKGRRNVVMGNGMTESFRLLDQRRPHHKGNMMQGKLVATLSA